MFNLHTVLLGPGMAVSRFIEIVWLGVTKISMQQVRLVAPGSADCLLVLNEGFTWLFPVCIFKMVGGSLLCFLQQVRLVGPAAADCRVQLQESAGPSAARLHVAVSTCSKKLGNCYF